MNYCLITVQKLPLNFSFKSHYGGSFLGKIFINFSCSRTLLNDKQILFNVRKEVNVRPPDSRYLEVDAYIPRLKFPLEYQVCYWLLGNYWQISRIHTTIRQQFITRIVHFLRYNSLMVSLMQFSLYHLSTFPCLHFVLYRFFVSLLTCRFALSLCWYYRCWCCRFCLLKCNPISSGLFITMPVTV